MRRALSTLASRVLPPVLFAGFMIGLWHVIAARLANPELLPPPKVVGAAFVDLLIDGDMPDDIIASLQHLGLGFGIGAGLGLLLAALCARFSVVMRVLDPLIELFRPIGAIAWIPFAILMFGVSSTVPVFLIGYGALFPIFVSTLAGVRGVDAALLRAGAALGASPRMVVTHVVLPAALPHILSGARLSMGVAWAAMIAAELTGSDSGLGWRLFWYQEFFRMDRVAAVILMIGLLGVAADLLLRLLRHAVTGWSAEDAHDAR
jgi:ABC-type nitrate/sulfonate/bicarbonate transport system permease component